MYCMQPLIPIFSQEFHLTPSVASLAMSFTTGSMAVAMFAIAGFAGFLDRKLTMTVSLFGSTFFAVAAVFSSDFTMILIFRAIQGILVAGFPAIAMAYINEEFDPDTTGLVIGIYVSGTSIGGLTGRIIVSTLTDFFSWKIALICLGVVSLVISAWFCCVLPKSRHFIREKHMPKNMLLDILQNLRNKMLLQLYVIAFCLMGAFMAMYNYIGYPLMAPPYNLSQTAIGGLFTLYLVGTFSSTFMGGMADRHGNERILCLSIGIMIIGGIVTLLPSLIFKIMGLAIFTFGFFGSHSTACGWVGKCCSGDKAQAASLYLLFYYFGSSVIGTTGGLFLASYGWAGVIFLISLILGGAILIAGMLLAHEGHHLGTPIEKS